MTEKRFTFIKDTVATNLKTPIVYNNEKMSIGEVLEMLNELSDENEQLKYSLSAHMVDLNNYKGKCSALEEDYFNVRNIASDLRKENEELKEKLESLNEIINNQIYEVKHTHKNCKNVGIAELKKLKKVLICNSIIDGDVE